MSRDSTRPTASSTEGEHFLCDDWFDPLENGVRTRIRGFIEDLLEAELDAALGRARYERPGVVGDESAKGAAGSRHGHRERRLLGTFGATIVRVPRARLATADGKTCEWRNTTIPAYQRRTKRADALIAGALSFRDQHAPCSPRAGGAVRRRGGEGHGQPGLAQNQRRLGRLERALACRRTHRPVDPRRHGGARASRQKGDVDLSVGRAWCARGRPELLAIKNMGGESEAAWRALLDNLVARGLRSPELLIVDGGAGLDKALAALWPDAPVQRCTVHKHRNLLAHAPDRLHEEVSADYNDMIYAALAREIEDKRKAFPRKWRLKCKAVADSLEEAGDRLFTFARFPQSQWKSIRTTNAIERLHEEFKRRIKTQTVLPSAETAAMLFWALLASGQIVMRKVDGWKTLAQKPSDQIIDLAA